MLIKNKLLFGSMLLAFVPALIVSAVTTEISFNESRNALTEAVQDHLVAIRETKRIQIEDYFGQIHNQVVMLSASDEVIEALDSFGEAFASVSREESQRKREELSAYYVKQFGNRYRERNPDTPLDPRSLLGALDDAAVALQYQYIQASEFPLGEKHRLDKAPDGSDYSRQHAHYHPFFREYLERFGFYDIFLVEAASGRLVYSVFKELDFATSLKDGPYADSGIGEAYRASLGKSANTFFQGTYQPYRPSYDDQAAFVSSPVYDHGELTGVLIFQLSLDKINSVMTSDGEWQKTGLGESGETYLVGPDGTLRNNSRFQSEDAEAYLQALAAGGVPAATLETIRVKQTGIGLQPVNTPGSRAALSGETGFALFRDYRGVEVLSAYAPLHIDGLRWALLSEIDKAEAYASSEALHERLIATGALIAGITIAISALIGWLFSRSIALPLRALNRDVVTIGENANLVHRLDESRKDELGLMAASLNRTFGEFRKAMLQINDASGQVSGAASQLTATAEQARGAIETQQLETDQVATAMEEMSVTAKDVAGNTDKASAAANDAAAAMREGADVVQQTQATINKLANEVSSAADAVTELKAESEAIGGVLDVIRNVAEQTNLLALNAAIEAARAGEQGRGFAVVADEVRSLASRTQESTDEIQSMIGKLQAVSDSAATMMDAGRGQTEESVRQVDEAGNALARIGEAIERINDMSHQIASAAEEQSVVTNEVTQSAHRIVEASHEASRNSVETTQASESLNQLADHLRELVSRFRIQ